MLETFDFSTRFMISDIWYLYHIRRLLYLSIMVYEKPAGLAVDSSRALATSLMYNMCLSCELVKFQTRNPRFICALFKCHRKHLFKHFYNAVSFVSYFNIINHSFNYLLGTVLKRKVTRNVLSREKGFLVINYRTCYRYYNII